MKVSAAKLWYRRCKDRGLGKYLKGTDLAVLRQDGFTQAEAYFFIHKLEQYKLIINMNDETK